jgi:hypothetical protein
MNILEFNENSPVIVEEFMGSKIYYIDNFFKNPDSLVNFLDGAPITLHTPFIRKGFKNLNGVYFSDMRHSIHLKRYSPILKYLSKICGKEPECDLLQTNYTIFKNIPFNDYKNNYWWPHKDAGYTALIYLNKNDKTSGTNLYKPESEDETLKYQYEHSHPWRSKRYYSVIKTIEPVYNRCVLFDGLHFLHGMNIENERYFNEEYRKNMAFFLSEKSNLKL